MTMADMEYKNGALCANKTIINDENVNNLNVNDNINLSKRAQDKVKKYATGNNYSSISLLKNIIRENRSYFLNYYQGDAFYFNPPYLDAKIKSIPEGKHFIFTTDSHIDYYNCGLSQKDVEIMAYVKDKINASCVIFGGDCIGGIPDSSASLNILDVYSDDKFDAFGSDFIWCQGNHDVNYQAHTAGEEEGLHRIYSVDVYKSTIKRIEHCENFHFDEEGLEYINNLQDVEEEDASVWENKKNQIRAWWKLHYYYDDPDNEVRYIVIESGDGSEALGWLNLIWRSGEFRPSNPFDGFCGLNTYIKFVADALYTCPDKWDIVIVMHQMAGESHIKTGVVDPYMKSNFQLYALLSAFKNKESIEINGDGSIINHPPTEESPGEYRPYIYYMITSIFKKDNPSGNITYDFSQRTGGRCFMISGHFHHDDAWIFYKDPTIPHSDLYKFRGREYDSFDDIETIKPDDYILHIQTDRACMYGSRGSAKDHENPNWPCAYSYPDNGTGEGQEIRKGTPNEVLFDVITITSDNNVICTRIGAGEKEYRQYTL